MHKTIHIVKHKSMNGNEKALHIGNA